VNASFDEPTIPPRIQRPLAAVWISLGLHAALIALVQVAPPGMIGAEGPVIEARLVSKHAASPATEPPVDESEAVPSLASSESNEALPISPVEAPSEPAQPAAVNPVAVAPVEPLSPPSPAPPVAITSSVDLTYYSARDVDVHPRALREIVPDYPEGADRQGVSGTVRLQLKLEADGRVMDAEVVRSTPPGVFDEAALKAFRAARFAPALKDGRPVRALMLVEMEFVWEGRPQ